MGTAAAADCQLVVDEPERCPRLVLQAWRAMMRFDSRPWLARIGCPTLVIAGAADTGVPIHHARMLHQGIPQARLAVVGGAGHTLIWTHTEQFLTLVEAFLDE